MALQTSARHRIIDTFPKLFLLIDCLALGHRQCHGRIAFLRPTGVDMARYRDERLQKFTAGSVRRELTILSQLFGDSRKDWGIFVRNPVRDILNLGANARSSLLKKKIAHFRRLTSVRR